jgi:hypothetical protein
MFRSVISEKDPSKLAAIDAMPHFWTFVAVFGEARLNVEKKLR